MPESRYITEQEFNLATGRLDDENKRQNKRIDLLEENYAVVNKLAIQMERLATSMESMARELSRQGLELNEITSKPAKRFEYIITTIIGGVIGAIIGFVTKTVLP